MTVATFVVDTNVVVAGLITDASDSPVVVILDAMLSGRLVYLMSPALLDEYRYVLLRPRISQAHGLREAEVDRLLVEITANAVWREPESISGAPDPGNDHLWALMAEHPGIVLITGDRLLHERPPVVGSVISPRTYVDHFLRP